MREGDSSIRPDSVSTGRRDSTMFAALHGELASHPWRDPSFASSDAYSLFYARSSAMGWLTEAKENASGGLWGMNDAGLDAGPGSQSSRIAWFQVVLTEPVPADRPLPVQAFLSCAGDVLARIGTLRLQRVEALLPVQSLDPPAGTSSRLSAVTALLTDSGWFEDSDPRLRARVRVTLDGGQNPSIRSVAPEMLRWVQELRQSVFSCDSFSLADDDHVVLEPPALDESWLGPGHHRVTFRGTLVEWSLDALGWVAAFLAEASSRHGVSTQLMLTASRCERAELQQASE
jgi:hypothetical protein